mmetsp:Transcript_4419/g.9557  ORF Transcript_4419/g.9557 Transcript_4419/m.9557 type:complete len:139 (-) Transcript_4419:283-699(-)
MLAIASDESAPSTASSASGNGHEMDAKTILQLRREMRAMYYAKGGKKNRAIAEAEADRFIRSCCNAFGGDAAACDKILAEFDAVRKDFGWKEDYGKLTPTGKAAKKRERAESKAENVLAVLEVNGGNLSFLDAKGAVQ